MKKMYLALMMATAVCLLSLFGCASKDDTTNDNSLNKLSYTCETSGIVAEASNVSATGMTLTYTWPGHDANHTVTVSGVYYIEEWDGEQWSVRSLKDDVSDSLSYGSDFKVTGDGLFEDKIDWTVSYGELPKGRYRFSKSVNFNNSDTESFYIEFVVE